MALLPPPRILRLPREGEDAEPDDYILIHITSTSATNPLDVNLLATEAATSYALSLKQSRISTLRSKNHCSQADWELILASIILGTSPSENANPTVLAGVEAVAEVKDDREITLIIRRRIEGITQRLGTLTLPHDPSRLPEVQLFDWCGIACSQSSLDTSHLTTLQQKFQDSQKAVKELTAKLEEITKEKERHEAEMLLKCRDLLNAKKVKIRDQQRLLETAVVDKGKLAAVKATRGMRGRTAKGSRVGKRKKVEVESEDEESDEGFEKMDVDVESEEKASTESEDDVDPPDQVEAEQETETEGESEAESSDEGPLTAREATVSSRTRGAASQRESQSKAAASQRGSRTMGAASQRESQTRAAASSQGNRQKKGETVASQRSQRDITPPRKELPVSMKKAAPAAEEENEDDEETESGEDDEL